MSINDRETVRFNVGNDKDQETVEILRTVYNALKERGYQPNNQIIGYLMSGDPTYITSHNDARKLIRKIDRNDLLEELLVFYLKENNII